MYNIGGHLAQHICSIPSQTATQPNATFQHLVRGPAGNSSSNTRPSTA